MTEALARRTDPSTSHEAAAFVNVNALERKVLGQLNKYLLIGLTTSDIAFLSETPRDSVSPRMTQLEERGLVERTIEKRVPHCLAEDPGNKRRRPKQIVWKISEKGVSVFALLSQSETV